MNIEKIKSFSRKHPLIFLGALSAVVGILGVVSWYLTNWIGGAYSGEPYQVLWEIIFLGITTGVVFGEAVVFPLLLMAAEIRSLFHQIRGKNVSLKMRYIDLTAIVLGVLYNILLLSFLDSVMFQSDWNETLYNAQKHTPIFTESYPTVWAIIGIAIIGYLLVSFVPLGKLPPLALVLGLSAMYLGTLESILWMVQTFKGEALPEFLLLILPICCVCITARTVIYKVREWNGKTWESENRGYGSMLESCNRLLQNANRWPVAAFLLMWPLLGIIIGILMLFGQKPDAVIKAWTETSDWNLSQRIAPQNLYKDEHYLCTVAAGGHKKIVKPIRLGVRHGHEVIVNRQLCIANAFEQILEERTPRFHKVVRGIYDKYGFPVARLIRSKRAADMVYFIMKPAEWFFLMVLYLVDVNPENRIAIQYTGKRLEDF